MNGTILKVCDKVMSMKIKIVSRIEILDAMARTAELAESMGFPPKEQTLLSLVTEEALANAWEHGRSTESSLIEVDWMINGYALQLAIKQKGKRFKLETPEISSVSLRGRGLQLIKNIMDEVWLEEENEMVVLHMKKQNKREIEGGG